MWWLVWVVLVLGALATFAVVGRDLWVRVKALGRQAGEAAELLGRLDAAAGDEAPSAPRHVPGVTGDEATLARARATRDRVAAARGARRSARLARVTARWRSHGLVG